MKQIKPSTYAKRLIAAVHFGSPTGLRTAIALIQNQHENLAGKHIAISQGLCKSGPTALHVASYMYSLAKTDAERNNAEALVAILIECGAFLTVDALIEGRKQTPLEVCNGKAPKVLYDAVVRSTKRQNNDISRFSITVKETADKRGMEEEEYRVFSSGYGFIYAV